MHLTNNTKPRVESQLYSMTGFIQPSLREKIENRRLFSPIDPAKSPLFMERASYVLGIPPSLIRCRKGVNYRPKSTDKGARQQLLARQACAYVMSVHLGYELGMIANALGIEQKAVRASLPRAAKRIKEDPGFANMVDALEMCV